MDAWATIQEKAIKTLLEELKTTRGRETLEVLRELRAWYRTFHCAKPYKKKNPVVRKHHRT